MKLNTVMVVDDCEAEQFLYKHTIEAYEEGVNVISAYDGEEALEILHKKEQVPTCIFLDINMPRMNGFEFLEAYSDQFDNNHIIIVMLTSSAHTNDQEKAMSYPCVKDFFLKPIIADDLAKIPRYLEDLKNEHQVR